MTHGIVVLLGNLSLGTPALNRLVQEFGWSLETTFDLDQLRELSAVRNPVAILFDANSLGLSWREALRSVREIDSQALLIACHRFSDTANWPELAEAGAFHALALPLDPSEVRHSLGFVWSERFRRAAGDAAVNDAGGLLGWAHRSEFRRYDDNERQSAETHHLLGRQPESPLSTSGSISSTPESSSASRLQLRAGQSG